ncbi:MAG: hypothetical protein ACPG5P_00075 [Saprospiraceae bacterium]
MLKYLGQLRKLIPNPLSLFAILMFVVTTNTIINTEGIYKQWDMFLRYDQLGYFGYLPATFVHDKDWEFDFLDDLERDLSSLYVVVDTPDGKTVNKYAAGPAALLSPFYWVTHKITQKQSKFPANGMSQPYKHSVILGCIFYVTLAFFFLRAVLLRYFPDITVALTIITLGLGSNLLNFTTANAMMSHAYSFFLFSLLLWLVIRWIEDEKKMMLLPIGLTMGMIACTRIPNLMVGLIPLLWGIKNIEDCKARIQLLWKQKLWIIGSLFCCVLGFFPQMLYFKSHLGQWFHLTYTNETFWFSQPLIHRVLFSFRHGWLIYSPLMGLSLVGFFFLKKKVKGSTLAILSFFLINLYVVSSWWCWWYAGSFGMRALVESTAILSLPIATAINVLIHKRNTSYIFSILFTFLIGLSLLQHHQAFNYIIPYDGMTFKSYKAIFGRVEPVHQRKIDERDKYMEINHDFFRATTDRKYRWEENK